MDDCTYANSTRLADYLVSEASCDSRKVEVLPNATRASNVLPFAPSMPAALPSANLPWPIAGVVGNMAENLDWLLITRWSTALRTSHASSSAQPAWAWKMSHSARPARRCSPEAAASASSTRDQEGLAAYARSFFAVIPYAKHLRQSHAALRSLEDRLRSVPQPSSVPTTFPVLRRNRPFTFAVTILTKIAISSKFLIL